MISQLNGHIISQEREIISQKREIQELRSAFVEQTRQICDLSDFLRTHFVPNSQQNSQQELLINRNLSPVEENINPSASGQEILPWIDFQISGEQQPDVLMQNVEGSERDEDNEVLDNNENSANARSDVVALWPQEWVTLKGKSLDEAFFALYALKLAEIYEVIDKSDYDKKKKNNLKNTWYVIRKSVQYMKYFAPSEIVAPPVNGSPMEIAQWKRSLATIARAAQERTVQHLIDKKLRKKKTYSLSGNARVIVNAPRPTGRRPVRDYLSINLNEEEIDDAENVEPSDSVEEEPLPSLLPTPISHEIEDHESDEEADYVPISLEEHLLRSIERHA